MHRLRSEVDKVDRFYAAKLRSSVTTLGFFEESVRQERRQARSVATARLVSRSVAAAGGRSPTGTDTHDAAVERACGAGAADARGQVLRGAERPARVCHPQLDRGRQDSEKARQVHAWHALDRLPGRGREAACLWQPGRRPGAPGADAGTSPRLGCGSFQVVPADRHAHRRRASVPCRVQTVFADSFYQGNRKAADDRLDEAVKHGQPTFRRFVTSRAGVTSYGLLSHNGRAGGAAMAWPC